VIAAPPIAATPAVVADMTRAERAWTGTLGPAAGALLLLARIAFSYMFIMAGYNHLTGLDRTLGGVSENMPFIPQALQPLFAWGAVALLLGGGLMVLLGAGTRIGALMVAVFLIPTLLFFHDYWNMPAEEVRMQTIQFQKNLAMIGGAIYILTLGAGPYSVDALFRKRS
jgi:putative oxidoreductase